MFIFVFLKYDGVWRLRKYGSCLCKGMGYILWVGVKMNFLRFWRLIMNFLRFWRLIMNFLRRSNNVWRIFYVSISLKNLRKLFGNWRLVWSWFKNENVLVFFNKFLSRRTRIRSFFSTFNFEWSEIRGRRFSRRFFYWRRRLRFW